MLRIVQQKSAVVALGYYKQELGSGPSGYYAEGQEAQGVWSGELAGRLGLEAGGAVEWSQFERLCGNRHPTSEAGERLTAVTITNRRVLYDLSWSAPKSVSLLYEFTQSPEVLAAFRSAVDAAMLAFEQEIRARVRVGGADYDRVTAEGLWATFVHRLSRPVDSVPDPQLHAHCTLFNATYDQQEGRYKALTISEAKSQGRFFEALFHAHLARNLRRLGYAIDKRPHGRWEVAGFAPELLRKFSRRTAEIEALAAKMGVVDPEAKDRLGASSRSAKRKEPWLREELMVRWKERLTHEELRVLSGLKPTSVYREDSPEYARALAARAVAFALEHCLERKSVVKERTLLAEALRWGVGWVEVAEVFRVLRDLEAKGGVLIKDGLVSTVGVLREEQRMLQLAREGKGVSESLAPGAQLSGSELSPQQLRAARHVLGSRDRVILVRGAAGTGKTFLLTKIAGHLPNLTVLAPSAEASRGVLRAEGFEQAETVARFLVDERMQSQARGGVVWVDEAGLVGTRTLVALLELTATLDARLLLMGDRRQNPSVERGATLRQLEEEAGLVSASVTEIRRQRGEYRDAVHAISRGRVAEGFYRLDDLGWVTESRDHLRDAAVSYADLVRSGKRVVAVCPTHAEGQAFTSYVRQALGVGAGVELGRLESKRLTLAEKRSPQSYEVGDVVEYRRGGKRSRVLEVTDSAVRLEGGKDLYLLGAGAVEVYRPEGFDLAVGESVRVTKNSKSLCGRHRLNNGAVYGVKAIDDKAITLDNGWRVSRDFGHLAHAYVSTSLAAQGKTADVVVVVQGVASRGAASAESWYVSVSRGREKALVFTDSKAALLRSVEASADRTTATEVFVRDRRHVERERLCDTRARCPVTPPNSTSDPAIPAALAAIKLTA